MFLNNDIREIEQKMKLVMKFAKIIYKCLLERQKEVKITIASKKQL